LGPSGCSRGRLGDQSLIFGISGALPLRPKINPKTPDATKNQSKNNQKSRKIGSGTTPGALEGGSETSLAPRRFKARKGHQKATKKPPVFGTKMETRSNFSLFFFKEFFEVLVFQIFHDFRCPRTSFWISFWLYFESSGPLGKQLKVL